MTEFSKDFRIKLVKEVEELTIGSILFRCCRLLHIFLSLIQKFYRPCSKPPENLIIPYYLLLIMFNTFLSG